MAWYRLAFHPAVADDLATADPSMAQRLFDKTKWLASNAENLRHESVDPDLPGLSKYAVGDWRIFYTLDRAGQFVNIHAIVRRSWLRSG
ncbi:MAG TPA: type II toxin-antitoxin system RelE/ParE family toxin [Nitrospira sp.]|nr:type II toxin-antitoxin system RelE/ParE family toxin [Nitrospira sp.]